MIIKSTTGQLKIIKSAPISPPSIFYFLWPLKVIDMKFNKHVYFIVCIMRLIFCLRQSTIKTVTTFCVYKYILKIKNNNLNGSGRCID